MRSLSVALIGFAAVAQALTCPEHTYDLDGACKPCTYKPCGIGLYRKQCEAGSTKDAECVACSPAPPEHGTFVTGGLPYLMNNCQTACKDGFFKAEDLSCKACSTAECTGELKRSKCYMGATADSVCKCDSGQYIDGNTCKTCSTHVCEDFAQVRESCDGTGTADAKCV